MSEAAVLLADHLLPDLREIDTEIDNLNRSLPCSDKKTAAAAVKTYTCELRLKDEIPPDFTLDECRARFLAEHPNEAKAIWEKEMVKRERKKAHHGATATPSPEEDGEVGEEAEMEGEDE